jgi:hypothetical protein
LRASVSETTSEKLFCRRNGFSNLHAPDPEIANSLYPPTWAEERMEKIKQKLIRATVSMPIAPVMVFQSVVNDHVLIYCVGGGLQTGMYSAQGLVCHASKMDGKSGKEWFVCKCAHILGVTMVFGSLCNFFCVAILEYGREYTYDKNTGQEIFATVVTAVSATRTIYRDLALLWHMLQAGDLMDSFGNGRAVIWLTLLPTGKKTNMTLHLKAPDDAIAMNAKGIIDDTDVVCYVGVILAASVGDNTDNRLCLIALTERSGGMWEDLRVFTDQTAYLVYRAYDAPLWWARIEPGTLHAILSELRSYDAILHHQELKLAARSMPGMEALPEWTMAGFYGSVGTDGSNFAGQTLEQGAQLKHGCRRMAQACVTTVEYRASLPATHVAGQNVAFHLVSNSAVQSGLWLAFSALSRDTTDSAGVNIERADRRADIWRVTVSGKAVGRCAHVAGLALSTSKTKHLWTDTDPAPISGNALGPLSELPTEGVSSAVTPATPAALHTHISLLHGLTKADLRSDALVLIVSAAEGKEPMLQRSNFRRAKAGDADAANPMLECETVDSAFPALSVRMTPPRALHTGSLPHAPDSAAAPVPTVINTARFTIILSSTPLEPVCHARAASFLVTCVNFALFLCLNLERLAALFSRSLLVLTTLLGWHCRWCGKRVLITHSGRPRVPPPPVSGYGSMWASPERAQDIRPLRGRQLATGVVLNGVHIPGERRAR